MNGLAIAPNAQAVCSFVGAMVSVNDFADRLARALADGEVFEISGHRLKPGNSSLSARLGQPWLVASRTVAVPFIASGRSSEFHHQIVIAKLKNRDEVEKYQASNQVD